MRAFHGPLGSRNFRLLACCDVISLTGSAAAVVATSVLGPLMAHARLGGARAWGLTLAAYAAGSVLGGLIMIQFRPARMLLAATLAVPGASLLLFSLASPLPLPAVAVAALIAGTCLQVFGVNWATTMQQQIPPSALSRVSAYDALSAASSPGVSFLTADLGICQG